MATVLRGTTGFQSTHPVWGATGKSFGINIPYMDFNPRTPCGVRQIRESVFDYFGIFQSTHPVWGATLERDQPNTSPWISIHAPRVGCDVDCAPSVLRDGDFNPRTPCGVRRIPIDGLAESINISIHAPRVGCDESAAKNAGDALISIHAPRVGCDALLSRLRKSGWNFNPRTPCGVRLQRFLAESMRKVISIHAPRVGCDERGPGGGQAGAGISIHAPRVGCDGPGPPERSSLWGFQSTHPVWGATPMQTRTRRSG